MAAILDPGEFKRCFEKAERYATAAVEIKKLDDTKNLIKRAKDAKGILEVEKKIKEVLNRTRNVLAGWEKSLAEPFKKVFSSRRVLKMLEEEVKINERNLADSVRQVGDTAVATKKAGNAQGQMRHMQNLLDTNARDMKSLEDFMKDYRKAEPKIKDGSLPAQDLVKLETTGKTLVPKLENATKLLKRLEKDYAAIAEAEHAKLMTSQDQSKLKDARETVEKRTKELEKFTIKDALEQLKGGRKSLGGDKESWMALVDRASEVGSTVTKLFADLNRAYDAEMPKFAKLAEKFPDPKASPNIKPEEFIKKLPALRELKRTIQTAENIVTRRLGELQSSRKTFGSRIEKIKKAEFFIAQGKIDVAVAASAKGLDRTNTSHDDAQKALDKRSDAFRAAHTAAKTLLEKRMPEYVDIEAKTKRK